MMAAGPATLVAVLCTVDLGDLTRSALVRTAGGAVGIVGSFRLGARLAILGYPRAPQLEPALEAFAVGERSLRVGPSRCRARLWYPCDKGACDGLRSPYLTDGRSTSLGMAELVGFDKLGVAFLLDHLADGFLDSYAGATPAERPPEGFPLLVYSHGFGGNMDMAAHFLRGLASSGAVVVALEHTDGTSSRTVAPDGNALSFSPRRLPRDEQLQCRALELLAAMDVESLPEDVAREVDVNRRFLGGHSYGGPSALMACSLAKQKGLPLPKGLILHDPAVAMSSALTKDDAIRGLDIDSYFSDEYFNAGLRLGRSYHCTGARHGNFVDAAFWAPKLLMRIVSLLIPATGPTDPDELYNGLTVLAGKAMETQGAARAIEERGIEGLQAGIRGPA